MSSLIAITNVPSPLLHLGVRTFAEDAALDHEIALREHEGYRAALERCGCRVIVLEVNREYPDSVFVEDTALVLDETAIMMSPGAPSRRDEPRAIEPALRDFRPIERIAPPATIDGGDIVRSGRRLYVGQSQRTNEAGIAELGALAAPHGYDVVGIPVFGCLHLKSGCSALPDGRFLVNPNWIDVSPLPENFVQAAAALKRLKPAPKEAERPQRGQRHGTKTDRRADGQRREHRNDRQRHPHRAEGHPGHRSAAQDGSGQRRDDARNDGTRSSYRPEAFREADAGPRMPRPANGNLRSDGGQPKRKFHGRPRRPGGGQRRAGSPA